jgi:prophage antirepressor-like protein
MVDFRLLPQRSLKEINDLCEIVDKSGQEINPRGMKLINYAGFNHAMMKSNKPNAKIIQSWIYGTVMPSVAETGQFDSENNTSLTQENSSSVTIPKEEYNQLFSNLNNLQQQLFDFKTQLKSIDHNQQQLVNFNKYQIPNKFFTLEECCDYLNMYFKNDWQPDIVPDSLIEYMKHIKLIKKDTDPYIGYVKYKYIVRKFDPFNKAHVLKLSKAGIDWIIEKLQEDSHI